MGAIGLLPSNNLSDLFDAATARTNLGLGTAATVADSSLVHLAGTETISGAKTFSADTVFQGIVGIGGASAGRQLHLRHATLPIMHLTSDATGHTTDKGSQVFINTAGFWIQNQQAGAAGDINLLPGSGRSVIVTGATSFGGNIAPDANNTRNTGSSSNRWATVYGVAGDFSGTINAANGLYAGAGGFVGLSGRWFLYGPADGQMRLVNNTGTTGVLFDFATDGTLKLRNRSGTSGTGNLDVGNNLVVNGTLSVSNTSTLGPTVVTNDLALTGSTGRLSLNRFTVATLPTPLFAGQLVYATDGRNSGEGAGSGTGCVVRSTAASGVWKTLYDNTTVAA